MSGKKRRNESFTTKGSHKTRYKPSDRKPPRRNGAQTERDPLLVQKRLEIEVALAAQRERKLRAVDENISSMPTGAEAPVAKLIPGYYYDSGKQRYFKIIKGLQAPFATTQRSLRRPQTSNTLECPDSLLSLLGNRLIGRCVRSTDVMRPMVRRIHAHRLEQVTASASDVMSFHPCFGLAVSSGPASLQLISSSPPVQIPLRIQRGLPFSSLHWGPSCAVPVLGCIQHADMEDRIEIFKLDPLNGFEVISSQAIVGVLPSRNQKEIFQSMEWSVDGQGCFSGGDVGLWRHDIGGRRGRRLVLDGISIINTIEPRENGCITIGLRTGGVLEVDERDRDRKGRVLATMSRAIDHVHTLKDGYQFICQDITNNILLYDVRVPGVSVHTIRGCDKPITPRGFSYYEGEAAVRNRKFWISPRHEYMVVSDGLRGDESLVVVDPKFPQLNVHQINVSAITSGSTTTIQPGIIQQDNNAPMAAGTLTGYWKLVTNGPHWNSSFNHSERGDLAARSVNEWGGCYGVNIKNSGNEGAPARMLPSFLYAFN